MAMTSVSVQAPLFLTSSSPLENHPRPPVIGQEHDYQPHYKQSLVGQPVKDSTMSSIEPHHDTPPHVEPGGEKAPSEKPPLPPKPSNVEPAPVMSSTAPPPPSFTSTTEEPSTHQSPKLSDKSAKPTGIENSPPTGSETSRSFQPEGSFLVVKKCCQIIKSCPRVIKELSKSHQRVVRDP